MLPDNLLPCNSKTHLLPVCVSSNSRLNWGTWSTCMISENHTRTWSVWQNSHITSRAQLKHDSWDTSLRFGRVLDQISSHILSHLENIKKYSSQALYSTSYCWPQHVGSSFSLMNFPRHCTCVSTPYCVSYYTLDIFPYNTEWTDCRLWRFLCNLPGN